MTVRERVVRGSIASEHIVQFFDSAESRAECVAAFLAEGYRAGEPVMVVANPINWVGASDLLQAQGIPVQRLIANGMVVVHDARAILRRISRNGSPDGEAFDAVVGKSVVRLKHRGPRVRAYGEMVDMLAEGGDLPDAIKLEGFWNRLGDRIPFFLLCGYSAAHFVSTATHRALRDVCAAHSKVHRDAQDPLATWLLDTAHKAPVAAAITS